MKKRYRQILICGTLVMLPFIYGVYVWVYRIGPYQILYKIKQNFSEYRKAVKYNHDFLLFDPKAELDLTLKYLSTVEVPDTTEDIILKGLGISYNEKGIFITEKAIVNTSTFGNIRCKLYKAETNIGLGFSFLEFISTNSINPRGTLFFLHGHTCNPEELIGLRENRYADPIMVDLLKNDIRVIYPYKYDTYEDEKSATIQIKTALVGKTLEALEELKITALLNEYDEGKKIVFGFSHGAWQALLASIINKCDLVIAMDGIIPLTQITSSYPSFYTDYNVAVETIYNYSELFRLSKSGKIVILAGEHSSNTNKEYLNSILEHSPKERVSIVFYQGGHYISSGVVNEFINKEIEKVIQVE